MAGLSIITVNYNNYQGLQKTIESIINQTFTEFEYIVIDGGSEDGSKKLIEKNAQALGYWESEKDNGIYHAMNKGIRVAKGDYIFFLNSGDELVNPTILSSIMPYLDGTDIVYGNLIIREKDKDWEKKYPSNPTFTYFFNDSIPHSGGGFIKKSLFDKLGLYDESLKIIADWKFYLGAICFHNSTTKYIDKAVGVFDFNGISSKLENGELLLFEKQKVLQNEYPRFFDIYKELNRLQIIEQEYGLLVNSRVIRAWNKIKRILRKPTSK
jgi:glycosyltransferase involved in cell wall biosynthesis